MAKWNVPWWNDDVELVPGSMERVHEHDANAWGNQVTSALKNEIPPEDFESKKTEIENFLWESIKVSETNYEKLKDQTTKKVEDFLSQTATTSLLKITNNRFDDKYIHMNYHKSKGKAPSPSFSIYGRLANTNQLPVEPITSSIDLFYRMGDRTIKKTGEMYSLTEEQGEIILAGISQIIDKLQEHYGSSLEQIDKHNNKESDF